MNGKTFFGSAALGEPSRPVDVGFRAIGTKKTKPTPGFRVSGGRTKLKRFRSKNCRQIRWMWDRTHSRRQRTISGFRDVGSGDNLSIDGDLVIGIGIKPIGSGCRHGIAGHQEAAFTFVGIGIIVFPTADIYMLRFILTEHAEPDPGSSIAHIS